MIYENSHKRYVDAREEYYRLESLLAVARTKMNAAERECSVEWRAVLEASAARAIPNLSILARRILEMRAENDIDPGMVQRHLGVLYVDAVAAINELNAYTAQSRIAGEDEPSPFQSHPTREAPHET